MLVTLTTKVVVSKTTFLAAECLHKEDAHDVDNGNNDNNDNDDDDDDDSAAAADDD